jgi:lantibiotic modifying enzyme
MSMAPRVWKPLLEGDLSARAREAVDAIAEALAQRPSPNVAPDAPGQASLSRGASGLALFFGYLARSGGAGFERWTELAGLHLDEALDALAAVPMTAGLFGGFTGIAWTAQHLDDLLGWAAEPGDLEDDSSVEVDRALFEILAHNPWREHYDLVSGLVGIGVYCLERLPRAGAVRCLRAVIEHLHASAVVDDHGIYWHTRAELLPAHHREAEPLGYANLGVAHGLPGVISLLADACQVEPCMERARHLLSGSVSWLLHQTCTGQPGSSFGQWVSPRGKVHPARLGWCYGDPGVAAALLYAARKVGEAEWECEALKIARHAVGVPIEESGILDAALCHGAVGLAHLFNRIYQATAEELFAEAARLWYRRALDLRHPGEGIAGWPADPALLTGAAGIGLGLIAAISEVDPWWDRLLRVAIPPQ